MLERISAPIAYTIFDASLKAILLWGIAFLATRTIRSMSVHARHRVWTVVLLALLALPILALAGPGWSLPLGTWVANDDAVENQPGVAGARLEAPGDPFIDGFGRSLKTPRQDPLTVPWSNGAIAREQSRTQTVADLTIENDSLPVLAGSGRPQPWFQRMSLPVLVATVWLTGVAAMLLRLLVAVFRTSQIQRSSHRVQDPSLPAGVVVRESRQIESPAVVGWWRPCILLPFSWKEWTDDKRAAVLSHELCHIGRRDPELSLLAELATMLYWFHPVSWWTRRHLSRLAELTCDGAAAIAIGDRLVYARYLVEIAAANRTDLRLRLRSTMAHSSDVVQRVHSLLDLSTPLTARASRSSLAAIALVGAAAVVLLAAIRLTPANANEKQTKARSGAVRPNRPAAKVTAEPEPAQDAASEKQAIVTGGPVLILKGTAFLPDGSVAKHAVLDRSPADESRNVLSATIVEGQFAIKTNGTSLESPVFLIRTPDWNFQASLQLEGRTLRSECSSPQRVSLAPARVIPVKITDGERAIANAHVQVEASTSYKYFGTTRSNGIALLKIASDAYISLICAWSDDHRIGGLPFAPEPTNAGDVAEFRVEISRGEPVRALALDTQQRGVPNVPLVLRASTGGRHGLQVGDNPKSRQTTNAKGEAIFTWVPNWPRDLISVAVAEKSAWDESRDGDRKQRRNGAYQLGVVPSVASRTSERIAVTGQLARVPTGVSGVLLEFLADPGGDESTWDGFCVRCDGSGRFTARALPGCLYSVYVNDHDFVSNIWGGVIVASGTGAIRRPELTLTKGVPLEVYVTKGRNEEPMPDAWVSLETSQEGNTGPSFWGKTDQRGRYIASVAAGEVKVRVTEGNWSLEKTVPIVEGEPAKIHVHRALTDKQTITGRLVLPAGVAANLTGTTVKIAGMDGESDDSATAKADAQGHFSAGILAQRASILATSPGEDFFGCGIVDIGQGVIEIPLHPTIRYDGHVLGSNDEPLSGVTVRMTARLVDRDFKGLIRVADAREREQFTELFRDRVAVTDHAGQFVFPKTPQRMELTLLLTRPGENDSPAMTQIYLEPGQARPPTTIRLDTTEQKAPGSTRSLEVEMQETLRDCRLLRTHALVVVYGTGDLTASFKRDKLWDPEDPDEQIDEEAYNIYSYLPQFIDAARAAESVDRRQYFAARKWPFPGFNTLFLAAISADGKELGRLTLKLGNDDAAKKDLAAFLRTHLPPRRDARADYEAALSEAKRLASPSLGASRADSLWCVLQFFALARIAANFAGEGLRPVPVRRGPRLARRGAQCRAEVRRPRRSLPRDSGFRWQGTCKQHRPARQRRRPGWEL